MQQLLRVWPDVRAFLETGGDTMWVIFAATITMWIVTVERFWYLNLELPRRLREDLEHARKHFFPEDPWVAARTKKMLSVTRLKAESRLWLVATMVALCQIGRAHV